MTTRSKLASHSAKAIIAAAFIAALSVTLPTVGSPAAEEPECESDPFPIRITIENIKNARGTIKVELYSEDPDKKKGKKIARTRVKATKGETKVCLNAPGKGEYSIALYHDENDNKKIDQNFLGIPKEGFGFSTNPELGFSRPAHDDIRFSVTDKPTNVRISVVYL